VNLLYLVHRLPFPPDRGDRIRSWHLLRFLAEHAHVDLACLADEPVTDEQRRALASVCRRVAIVPLGGRSRWWHATRSLVAGRSATEGLFYSRQLLDTVRRWTAATRYDRAVAFCSSMGPYFDLPSLDGVPKFVDLVDVDSQKWFDYAVKARGAKRLLFALEGRRVRRLEMELAEKTESLFVVSEPEADLFRAVCPTATVQAISNGVDLDYFSHQGLGFGVQGSEMARTKSAVADDLTLDPGDREIQNPKSKIQNLKSLVFVGALDYRANIDGVTWFCREVWPLVRARYPRATLSLVGRNPVAAVRELGSLPGVELVGQVPDIRPFVAAATIAIAPLRVARGIQNKVLEGAAMGKPVISSKGALEGLDLVPGEHVLQADTPDEWLAAISLLFDTPRERDRLASAGQAFVQRHHAWSARLAPLADLLGLESSRHTPLCRPRDNAECPPLATHRAEAIAIGVRDT
jgi:polysaccharide biosynthesis protein PslH